MLGKSRFFIFFVISVYCVHFSGPVFAQSMSAVYDYYGPLVDFEDASGLDATPIHAGLLPNGKVFFLNNYKFFKYPNQDLAAEDFIPEYMFTMDPTPAFQPEPLSFLVQPKLSPLAPTPIFDPLNNTVYAETLTCGGHALTADGNLFIASGANSTVDIELYNQGLLAESLTVNGSSDAFSYNPFTDTWIQHPDMQGIAPDSGKPMRWYATVTRMANEKMLVVGGYERVVPEFLHNNSVEIFDVSTNQWTVLSAHEDSPLGLENPDYTHVFQYPYSYDDVNPDAPEAHDINIALMMGGSGEPIYFLHTSENGFWYQTNQFRPGAAEFIASKAPSKAHPNHGATSVMLPIRLPEDSWNYTNGSLLVAGGAHFSPMEGNIDVFDTGPNVWRPSIAMGGLRHHASSVLLPDGRVLILGGHDDVNAPSVTGFAQYVDPKNNFELSQGVQEMPEVRGYHAVTVLLPDGRVLFGGGNPGGQSGNELTNFRYYYPDYMFKERPQILFADGDIAFNEYDVVYVPYNTNIDEAALVGLGSMTHSYDMNQRHVQLRLFNPNITLKFENNTLNVVADEACVGEEHLCIDAYLIQGPEKKELTPPGHYMLFLLDEMRVPSIGKMVKVQ